MRYLDLTLPTLAENLALDEALLLEAETGQAGEALRVWEWPHWAVVLGAGGKLGEDVDEEPCRAEGVPILRRSSGGGTVLLGPGCLLFSLVLRFDRESALAEIRTSYRYILGRVLRALELPNGEAAGVSDLAIDGLKFSGNAQQRKRDHLLHHGTLLYDFNVARVERFLRLPIKQPDYRAGRLHANFMRNLNGAGDQFKAKLQREWGAIVHDRDWPTEVVARLVQERYASTEWIRRR
jgi:lipoate-protein ligase A